MKRLGAAVVPADVIHDLVSQIRHGMEDPAPDAVAGDQAQPDFHLITVGIAQADAVLLGPTTYRLFARMWPHQTDDVPMAKFLNHAPKYVVSRTPDKVGKLEWEPAILVRDDLVSALSKLKAETGKTIQIPGEPETGPVAAS